MKGRGGLRIALVEAPFGPAAWPSIGTSLLKTRLREAGHDAEVIYLSLRYLDHVGINSMEGLQAYQDVSDSFGIHLGDWIFAEPAFPETDWEGLDAEYCSRLKESGEADETILRARAWRAGASTFLANQLTSIPWARFDVVGLANSYSQLNASIALARRLRQAFPHLKIIIGGCGCADPMGYGVMKICDAFDAVVMGEADDVVVPLVESLVAKQPVTLPGVLVRRPDGLIEAGPETRRITDANSLPVPDYTDYDRYLPRGLKRELPYYIPIEASRGCWWGAKHHCTFCGLSPTKMPYFRKDPERFLAEVRTLASRHAPPRFMAVDNIMPHDYYATVCPVLQEASGGAEFFFEVKANLDARMMSVFADNVISQLQPGIESLSTPVLKLMKKGTTGIYNIYTLRLAEERGLRCHWSILFGFEGETVDHYRHQVELSRRMRHLRPPLGLVRCEVERYAPMYRSPAEHGLSNLRPSHWYRFCHPVDDEILELIAYRFDADRSAETRRIQDAIVSEAARPVEDWRDSYSKKVHYLRFVEEGSHALVIRRVGDLRFEYRLGPVAADLMRALAAPTGLAKLNVRRLWTHPSPYLDPLICRAIAAEVMPAGGMVEILEEDPTEVFIRLLSLGLVAEEEALAVALPLMSEAQGVHVAPSSPLARQLSGPAVFPAAQTMDGEISP